MEPKKFNNIFQINTNSSSDKENTFPSKYIKEKYPHLNEVVPKNSILFKVKYKPDIVINQYNQFSNNINNNLKIKPTPSLANTNKNNNQLNFYPQNKYYNEFTNNTLLNYLDENDLNNNYYNIIENIDKNYEESLARNNEFIFGENERMPKRFHSDKNKERNLNSKRRNILKEEKNIENLNNIIFNSPVSVTESPTNNNLYKNNIKNNNIYTKYINNISDFESVPKYEYEYFITNTNTTKNINIDDLNDSKTKQQLYKYFSPKNIFDKIITKKPKNNHNHNINYSKDYYYNVDKSNNNILNKKLNYYRIKLFKEFFKHFKMFYRIRLYKYFSYFKDKIKKLENTYKVIYKKNNTSKKTYINKKRKVIIMPSNDINEELSDINNNNLSLKNKQYKKIVKKEINPIIRYNIKNNTKTNIKSNVKNISIYPKNKYNLKSVPKMKVNHIDYNDFNYKFNSNNISTRGRKNIDLLQIKSFSPSPSFKFGKKKIIVGDISFKTEVNSNENELYRDSRELDKKFRQIQSRRIWSKSKFNNNNTSVSANSEKIPIKTEIDSQIAKIKKYMKLIKDKKENSSTQENSNINNILNTVANKKLIRTKKLDCNNNDINEMKTNITMGSNNIFQMNNENNSFNLNKIKKNKSNKNVLTHYKKNSMNSKKNKKIKTIILNRNIDQNPLNIFSSPKNNIYYSYNNKNIYKSKNKGKLYNVFTTLIKNIKTKDGRINIYINYYYLFNKKKSKKLKYDNLIPCENFEYNYINNHIKKKLSKIKEEDSINPNYNYKINV